MELESLAGGVPEKLGRIRAADLATDPYGTLAAVRESCPAMAVENQGYRKWAITRYDDVRRVLADRTVLRDLVEHRKEINENCLVRPNLSARLPHRSRRSFFDRDGESHHAMRPLVANQFTPAKVRKMMPRISELIRGLLDELPVGEPVDLVRHYTRPIAGTIVCELLGVPVSRRESLADLQNEMLTSSSIEAASQAGQELYEFALDLIETKSAEPGDDLSTLLLRLHEEGRMDRDELASTYILMVVAGMEPSSAIGNGVFALLSHRDQLAKLLAEPALFESCVDEIIRYESPFRILPPRYTSAPLEFDGVTVPAGELLLLSPAAANRDPNRFDEPDTFDVTRQPRGHLGFGHGPHRCLGSDLGKAQTSTALRMLFQRFPNARIAETPGSVVWRPGKYMRRLDSVEVVLA